jgi:predicted ferric reductase/Ca2+-binding EF-hand superfamily protein
VPGEPELKPNPAPGLDPTARPGLDPTARPSLDPTARPSLDPDAVQRLLGLRSRYLAQRLLSALDPWRAGVSTAADFHALAQTVVDAPVERKLAFLFRLADADESGRVDREELERMVNIGLAENGVVLRREDEHRLLEAMVREADVDHDGAVDFDEFRRIIERRPALQARMAERGVALLRPRTAGPAVRGSNTREALGWIRRWGVLGTWLALFVGLNLWLFVDAFATYRALGASLWVQIARGCGACLNLDAPLLLVPMLRHLWTSVRRTRWERLLPLDENVNIHRFLGEVVFGLALVHTLAHLINVATSSAPLWSPANTTGFALLGLLALIWGCARDRVRASGWFELFHWVHATYWLWFLIALLHGPVLWIWLLAPAIAYIVERTLRRSLRRPPVPLLDARPLASGVTLLRFARPPGFVYDPGDFVYLRVPAVARSEWHPFTLTSAPEEPEALTVHVRTLGNWTRALRERFTAPGSHRGQQIDVDGPYGTPSVHIRECEHVVTIAAGIGVTPFASLLQSLHLQRARGSAGLRLKRLHFVWISREQDSFEWFTQLLGELEASNAEAWLDIHIYFTAARPDMEGSMLELARTILHEHSGTDLITGLSSRTHLGRPDFRALLTTFAAEPGLPSPDVFFCGPAALARDLSGTCQSLGLQFRYERF